VSDPFGCAGTRDRVLAGWSAAAVRLREDANAEEDLALGGYRERLVVELAQNAADAAARAGVPGRLELTLRERSDGPPVLVAANTGAPLDAEGVQSLATLRASAKRDGEAVGRFGVGFAAVLAVTDEPSVLSRTGGVRFSRADTAALVAEAAQQAPELAAELRRRDGHVPVLRLPFETEGEPPTGYDTAVVLPLTDEAAADVVRAQLLAVDDVLLLALPALAEVVIDVDGVRRVLAGATDRWVVGRRAARWSDAERRLLLADRPTEERRQDGWSVLWALPRNDSQRLTGVVQAPTPTDEPLTLPALLLASFPLDPTRRHVAPGLLTQRIITEAAATYVELLVEQAAAGVDVLPLVPVGLPGGRLDAELREAVVALLPGASVLRSAEDGQPLRPRDAVALDLDADEAALAVLAPRVAGLVAAPRSARAALAVAGVAIIALADVVDQLPTVGDAETWRALYDGLSGLAVDPNAREALGALPVLLVDGRVVRGPRGLVIAEAAAGQALEPLVRLGLRVIEPDAVHPLLIRLGAREVSARDLLDDPAVRAAVDEASRRAGDDDDPTDLVDAVLALVQALDDPTGLVRTHPWLAELPLRDDGGDLAPASVLALPGSFAASVLDPHEIGLVAAEMLERWGSQVLCAAGVLAELSVLIGDDVDLDDLPEPWADVAGIHEWADAVATDRTRCPRLIAVRDLDLVLPGSWPDVVAHLADDPWRRRALVDPVLLRGPGGTAQVSSPTAWWLRRQLGLGASAPTALGLGSLLDIAPEWVDHLDDGVKAALGVLGGDGLDAAAAQVVLRRLADPDRVVDVPTALRAWRLLAELDDDRAEGLDLPDRVRVLRGHGTEVVAAGEAVVADDPRWLQRSDLGGLVVTSSARSAALAELLDLDLASLRAAGRVTSSGSELAVPDAVRSLLPSAPATWVQHDDLTVDGHAVQWWVERGQVHAVANDALARALAWSCGRWSARLAVARALTDPEDVAALVVEDAAG
jgi:hypothetical protein